MSPRSINIKPMLLVCVAFFAAASSSLCAQSNSNPAVLAGSSAGLHERPAQPDSVNQPSREAGSAADWAAEGQPYPAVAFPPALPAETASSLAPTYQSGAIPTPLPSSANSSSQAYQPSNVPAYPPLEQLPANSVPPGNLQCLPRPGNAESTGESRLRAAEPYPEVVTASATSALSPQSPVEALPSEQAPKRTPLRPSRDNGQEESQSTAGGAMQTIVSVGSSLLIVVGLFLGVVWVYRKSLTTTVGQSVPNQVVEVIGRTPIAARQQLVLVRFGNKLVLVSLVQGEARTISEITDPLEVDRLAGLCESGKSNSISSSFRNILAQGGAA